MTCQMTLHQLEFPIRLGWDKAERADLQMVSLTITLVFPEPPTACESDQLDETFCYHTLTEQLNQYLAERPFRLIEYLTKELYCFIKKILPEAIAVQVQTTKKPAIKALTGGVSFCYGDIP